MKIDSLRKWVQAAFVFLTNGYWNFPFTKTIYNGPLKVICSPGLNCYSCPAATTYCPIGALQQLFAGARMALASGQAFIGFFVLGTMGVIGGLVGRMVCGWACPFGLLQELMHKIPSPKFGIWPKLKYVKYGLLAVMVVALPLFAVDRFGTGDPWFCKYFCPAGTLEAGLPLLMLRPELRESLGAIFGLKLFILLLFATWSILSSRPFCRTACPLGAFYALFNRVQLVKVRLDKNRCTNCEACHKVCPMGVKFNEFPDDRECISCLACSGACGQNAIHLQVGNGFAPDFSGNPARN